MNLSKSVVAMCFSSVVTTLAFSYMFFNFASLLEL